MCWHNYTQHSGCGHIGECYGHNKFQPCDAAWQRLAAQRGPSSPPPIPQHITFPLGPPPKPASKGSLIKRPFRSMSNSVKRSPTTASTTSTRSASNPTESIPRSSTSSFSATGGLVWGMSDHEWEMYQCTPLTERVIVSSGKSTLCPECKKWVDEMRDMLFRLEKSNSVMGTAAFREFLRDREEPRAIARKLGHERVTWNGAG
ncbi:hypothetical protein BU26DRAFT_309303 [Trematosphaeria pertusa]|uniref:Uncharacterized protein n=1 Tax=Trematosphaeria pertusa TaxID=390896 RepID=A0A6A6IHC3_9PLEO|nr:uncharacterized protein BU26DRAFT_309303 [Trematosphaeria pertusa]KAF2248970.1 hypothetical protein BU26DRAFT_309303 [Trematosphaeria pertusa]